MTGFHSVASTCYSYVKEVCLQKEGISALSCTWSVAVDCSQRLFEESFGQDPDFMSFVREIRDFAAAFFH